MQHCCHACSALLYGARGTRVSIKVQQTPHGMGLALGVASRRRDPGYPRPLTLVWMRRRGAAGASGRRTGLQCLFVPSSRRLDCGSPPSAIMAAKGCRAQEADVRAWRRTGLNTTRAS
jgi:hypothetical protein